MPDKPVLYVGTGAGHRQAVARALQGKAWVNAVDAETDPESATLLAPALLPGGHTHVKNIDKLSNAELKEFAGRCGGPDLSAESPTLNAQQRKALGSAFDIVETTAKGDAGKAASVGEEAEQRGIRLSREQLKELTKRNSRDRASSVLVILEASGTTQPSSELLDALSSHAEEASVPWNLQAALEKEDTERIRSEMSRAEPIPTIAYLYKRALAGLLIAEGADAARAKELLPDLSDAALRDGQRAARSMTKDLAAELVEGLAKADRLARTGHGPAALAFACGTWARIARLARTATSSTA